MYKISWVLMFVVITSSYCVQKRFKRPHHAKQHHDLHPFTSKKERRLHIRLLQFHDEEEQPDLFEGDIAMDENTLDHWRVGYRWANFSDKFWPDGVVHYEISNIYDENSRNLIEGAINRINYMTCIKFIPWDGYAEDYLFIDSVEKPAGCWSYVGRRGGKQIISLRAPHGKSKGCLSSEGTPLHEMLHALGTFHEQSRWDRDKHVEIHIDNILPENLKNFKKQAFNKAFTKYPYDYNSLMHYGRNFFAKDRNEATITPTVREVYIGQRLGMSVLDCYKINDLYGCMDSSREAYYQQICEMYGVK